jgi:transcriptional regulator with XRE-family HTH domain
MQPINWPQIITAMLAAGLTQAEIAARCSCGQSTISELLRGATTDPRINLGLRVLALAREHGVSVPVLATEVGASQEQQRAA